MQKLRNWYIYLGNNGSCLSLVSLTDVIKKTPCSLFAWILMFTKFFRWLQATQIHTDIYSIHTAALVRYTTLNWIDIYFILDNDI